MRSIIVALKDKMYVTAAYFSQHDNMVEILVVSVEQPLPGITCVMTLIKGMP